MSAFEELGLCPEIIRAVEEDDWLLPSAVQQEAIPLILTGGDVLAAAETGSGKTGAFGLPSLQIVHEVLRGKCLIRDPGAGDMRCELSTLDKDMSVQVTGENLECKSDNAGRWAGIRATVEVLKGKYMFEVEIVKGLVRVGWSTSFHGLELGTESKGFGFGSTGKKSTNKQFSDYGQTFEEGDVIGCLLDRDEQTISFAKNGRDLGVAFDLPEEMSSVGLKPHICGKGFAVVCKFDGPMDYPTGAYVAIGDMNPGDAGSTATVQGKRPPLCMILEPTRDLAEQTFKVIQKFAKYLDSPPVKMSLLVGGMDDKEQAQQLEQGVDIVVGTLQKIMDHVRRERLDVSQIRFLILDEADDLQKKDEKKDISALNKQIKTGRKDRVQTLFFSATLHTPEVRSLIDEITEKATWVDLKGKDAVPDTVHHVVYLVDPTKELEWTDGTIAVHAKEPGQQPGTDKMHDKPSMSPFDLERPSAVKYSQSLKVTKPKVLVRIADLLKMSQCLVFCRTNIDCNVLEGYFNRLGGCSRGFGGKMESGKENPYSCVVLGGARQQKERQANLEAFKEGDVRFMICTDVAARGIDISGLPFVIQMTLSDDIENYIHRIGRCGRAERLGLAISLVGTEREKVWFHKCPSRGKNCTPAPGNTKLTIPFGPDGKMREADESKWWVDEGGCTVWHDEMDLLAQVETRIGMPVRVMDTEDFSVDGVIESPLGEGAKKKGKDVDMEPPSRRLLKRKKADGGAKGAIAWGTKKKDAAQSSNAIMQNALAPTVRELHILETMIQKIFGKTTDGITEGPARARSDILTMPRAGSTVSAGTGEPDAKKPATEKTKKKVRW